MSLAVGIATTSKNMGFEEKKGDGKSVSEITEKNHPDSQIQAEIGGRVTRKMSDGSPYTTEDEDDDDDNESKIQLGPQCTLKELSEKDKVLSFYFPTSQN